METNINWWDKIIELSKSIPYGDLKNKINDMPELRFLNSEAELISVIKNNEDAWSMYRAWLKINESDKKYIRKNKKLLSAILEEPINEHNIEMFGPTLSRIGNIPMWTHEHLDKLNNIIKNTDMQTWFNWNMVHVQNESSARYPWNVILTNWCYQIHTSKIIVTKDILEELKSKTWGYKAACLILSTIIQTDSLKQCYKDAELYEWARSLNPKIVKLATDLFDNTDECLLLIANTLFNETMSNRQKINERENNKIGKELLENIEFTFDW